MTALPISTVRQRLFGLVQQVNDDHDTVTVVSKSGENAVLLAESDWNALQETLYVLTTHGGANLLASAADARAGRSEIRDLLDPEVDPGPPGCGVPPEAVAGLVRQFVSEGDPARVRRWFADIVPAARQSEISELLAALSQRLANAAVLPSER